MQALFATVLLPPFRQIVDFHTSSVASREIFREAADSTWPGRARLAGSVGRVAAAASGVWPKAARNAEPKAGTLA